jgi:hypothetical protein
LNLFYPEWYFLSGLINHWCFSLRSYIIVTLFYLIIFLITIHSKSIHSYTKVFIFISWTMTTISHLILISSSYITNKTQFQNLATIPSRYSIMREAVKLVNLEKAHWQCYLKLKTKPKSPEKWLSKFNIKILWVSTK